MAINPDRLKQVMSRVRPLLAQASTDDVRSVAVDRAPPELFDASLRLLLLLDTPDDIPVMTPLLEQGILYWLLSGP